MLVIHLAVSGPALTPKALPLTVRGLSSMPGLDSQPGHVRKLSVIRGGGFNRVLWFPPPVTTG